MSAATSNALRTPFPSLGALPPDPRDTWAQKKADLGLLLSGNIPGSGAAPRRMQSLAPQARNWIRRGAA